MTQAPRLLGAAAAAPCVRTGAPLVPADADFDRLASCSPLRVYGKSTGNVLNVDGGVAAAFSR